MKLSLCGQWEYKQADGDIWRKAKVPGCNFLDLLSDNLIADPFVGANEKDAYWVSEKDWLYRKSFDLTQDDFDCDKLLLVCAMLDTVAIVQLNGKLIASVKNCHMKYEIDIKPFANVGKNDLEIMFYSPVNYVNSKQAIETAPANSNGLNGIVHIRKPQCHFGWDWGPILTPSGINGDIFIQSFSSARLKDIQINQHHENKRVQLQVVADIQNFAGQEVGYTIKIVTPQGEVLSQSGKAINNFCDILEIKNPKLWWTKELSNSEVQPLYEIVVTLFEIGKAENSKGEKVEKIVDSIDKKIGLRTIALNQSKDKFGQNFQFVLNGVPIFAKGANWIPADSFINRATYDVLEFYIRSAAQCNFNMLRVWGGGYYESDDFYDLCDKYGILVWQDFAFACQPYPFFEDEFRQNVALEVECNVKRLRHHASLCLWCGNNEIELMSIAWITRKKYVDWTKKYFYDILPPIVGEFDSVTPYIAGTPIGSSHNKGTSDDNIGDTHLWAVWHGLQNMQYYRKRMTRFCSEFGFESLPDIKSIQQFAKKEDYSLTSEVFKSHQKCNSGNKKMEYYIASRFRLPQKFEDYIYLSQVCQSECIRDATEHWRRNKGRCNGSLYWQYNDCWPTCSWASIDYHNNFKALQYGSKEFFAPTMLSFEDTKKDVKIFSLNDTLIEISGVLKINLIDFVGNSYFADSKNITLKQNASKLEITYTTKMLAKLLKKSTAAKKLNLKDCVLVAEFVVGNKKICRKTLLFDIEKNLNLPKSNVEVSVEVGDNVANYTLVSKTFARLVQLGSKVIDMPFDNNYFDLLPNESYVVRQPLCKSSQSCKQSQDGLALQLKDAMQDGAVLHNNSCPSCKELLDNLTVFSAVDVVPKASRFSDFVTRTKIFLIPINFFSWIYYKSLKSKKIKEDKVNK